jgi:hypothetical protein
MEVSAPSFDNPAVGWVSRQANTPLVSALVTRQSDTVRVLLLNKSPDAAARVALRLSPSRSYVLRDSRQLAASSPFDVPAGNAPGWQPLPPPTGDSVTVAPFSLLRVDLLLRR